MRLLREPFVHFVLLGALIFGAFWLRGDGADESRGRIVVSTGQIAHLAAGFSRTWQRPPTPAELDGLVADWIRDEIYYREAMAAGLDRDDTVVRRRLRQKMEFLVEDAVTGPPPSDATLQAFLDAHPDRFRVEPELTFRQVYVSRDRRGDQAEADARTLLAGLARAGSTASIDGLGDALMVPSDVEGSSSSDVARIFGDAFATALDSLPIGTWAGPVESGYGLHLVLMRERTAGRVPALAEVRDAVAREAIAAERQRMLDGAYAALRARYEVTIEPVPTDTVAVR